MHFDEVYHARTATEFLQDWRYGIEHDIYEWTHPHLAKYAMAGGIVAWGDNRVTATARPRRARGRRGDRAATRRPGPGRRHRRRPGGRRDRLGGPLVRPVDRGRSIATIPLPGARAIAMDEDGLRLVVGADDGSIWTIDATALDTVNGVGSAALPQPESLGKVDGAVRRVFVPTAGGAVLVETSDDRVITLDGTTGQVRGTVQLKAAGDLAPGGTAPVVNAPPDAVADPKAAASALASIVGGDAKTYEDRLAERRRHHDGRPDHRPRTSGRRSRSAIETGALAGLTVDDAPLVAVADAKGVELIDPTTGELVSTVDVGAPAHGLALATVGDAKLYVATDPEPTTGAPGRIAFVAVGGDHGEERPRLHRLRWPMPGPVTRVALRRRDRDGPRPRPDAGRLVLDDLRHRDANADPPAVFADAALPFDPSAWVMDDARDARPTTASRSSRSPPTGEVASVDVGQQRVRLAAARRPGRRRHGGLPLPARPDPVPPPVRRRPRRGHLRSSTGCSSSSRGSG